MSYEVKTHKAGVIEIQVLGTNQVLVWLEHCEPLQLTFTEVRKLSRNPACDSGQKAGEGMTESEQCICGVEVPAGDTGLCLQCEEGLLEFPEQLVESAIPPPTEPLGDAPEDREKEVI